MRRKTDPAHKAGTVFTRTYPSRATVTPLDVTKVIAREAAFTYGSR